MSDAFAMEAIRRVGQFLVRAVQNPSDQEARTGMSLAAVLAGMAFSNAGVALVHGLEYPIGARFHCSHGGGNALLLPHVMKFNLPLRRREFAAVYQALKSETHPELDESEAALASVELVSELLAKCGLPRRLQQFGVSTADLRGLAAETMKISRLIRLNPRTPTQADLETILTGAL
jgi:alcohol dehydrogenase class IV